MLEGHRHYVRDLIADYVQVTGSQWGAEILDDWRDWVGRFWLIKPKAIDIGDLLDAIRQAA